MHYIAAIALAGIGESDCEAIGSGLLAQPVNALSSVAYVAAGMWLALRATRWRPVEQRIAVVFAAVVVAVGVGSLLFHGPMPPAARVVHDLSIAAVFALVVARGTGTLLGWTETGRLAGFAVLTTILGLLFAAAPDASGPVTGALAVAAGGLELSMYRTGRRPAFEVRRAAWLLAIVAIAAAINVLGRTGAPLCAPAGLYQGHALWHLITAYALALYGTLAFAPSSAAS